MHWLHRHASDQDQNSYKMMVFCIFLVIISSSIAHGDHIKIDDQPCSKMFWGGICMHKWIKDCPHGYVTPRDLDTPINLPSGVTQWCIGDDLECCVKEPVKCNSEHNGKCKIQCAANERALDWRDEDCPSVSDNTLQTVCCVKRTDKLCEEKGSKCRDKCEENEFGTKIGTDLCEDLQEMCCSEKHNCGHYAGGKCRDGECRSGEKHFTGWMFHCYNGKKCCLDEDPCPTRYSWYNAKCRSKCKDYELPKTDPHLCLEPTETCCGPQRYCSNGVHFGECRSECDDDEKPIPDSSICVGSDRKCCVKDLCQAARYGNCRKNKCEEGEVEVTKRNRCFDQTEICCTNRHRCKQRFDGKCKTSCDPNDELHVHVEEAYLCKLSGKKCCVDKDPCETIEEGKCKKKCKNDEQIFPGNQLCVDKSEVCCVDDDPCQILEDGKCRDKCESNEIPRPGIHLCVDKSQLCCWHRDDW